MSASPPSPLPAHLRPIPVEIPATWTPEQALAVFELLDEIRDKIWSPASLSTPISFAMRASSGPSGQSGEGWPQSTSWARILEEVAAILYAPVAAYPFVPTLWSDPFRG